MLQPSPAKPCFGTATGQACCTSYAGASRSGKTPGPREGPSTPQDAALLAQLLRADLIPQAYIPPEPIQQLRDVTRGRARLTREATQAKNQIQTLLAARNIHPPVKTLFSKAGLQWLSDLDLGPAGNVARDELLRRFDHFGREIRTIDAGIWGHHTD